MHSTVIFLTLAFLSCSENEKAPADNFSYELGRPEHIYIMPKALKEISGISYLSENKLACIEDNHGIVYIYDLKKEKIIREVPFEDNGDFEDVSITPQGYCVLRSDGTIFILNEEKIIAYKTLLKESNNTEGLCYDKKNNSLLIACKDDPGMGLPTNVKAVYEFSLANFTCSPKPLFTIATDDIVLPKHQKNFEGDGSHFSPSALAIHPLTGNIFMISSRGNLLIEADRTGKIIHAEKIYSKLFPQPEGICFTVEGDLLISSEGKEHQHGTILRFKQK
ncbi:MAG: SdiA-regulated domain-containing protein [Cytophagaceae bacterium]